MTHFLKASAKVDFCFVFPNRDNFFLKNNFNSRSHPFTTPALYRFQSGIFPQHFSFRALAQQEVLGFGLLA